jgi:hypothetical protein
MEPLRRRSIEYCLVEHCNLSCYGCDHASPLLRSVFAELETFRADLAALGRNLAVDDLYLIGGEPLLHPQLADFVDEGRRSGIAGGVTIVTNGTLLHTLAERVWASIAGLDLTVYPGVRLRMSIEEVTAACKAHGVRLRVRSPSHFRTTLLNRRIDDGPLVQRIFDACRIAHDYGCHAVYQGKYYKCSVAPYMPQRLRRLGQTMDGWERDGVEIDPSPEGREALARYLADSTPLASCAYCLGTCGREVAHHQTNAAGRAAWLAESHADLDSLIVPERLTPVRRDAATPPHAAARGRLARVVAALQRRLRSAASWLRLPSLWSRRATSVNAID